MDNIMFAQGQTIRRRDGSIDIDFYREKGLMERRAVMTGFFKGASKLGRPLVAAAALAAALYMAPARDGTGYRTPTAGIAAPNSASLLSDHHRSSLRAERRTLISRPGHGREPS
jgi:hypothetical protein